MAVKEAGALAATKARACAVEDHGFVSTISTSITRLISRWVHRSRFMLMYHLDRTPLTQGPRL